MHVLSLTSLDLSVQKYEVNHEGALLQVKINKGRQQNGNIFLY